MKKRLGTFTLLCILSVPVYMYDLVNYSINKNKEKIESFIEQKTNQKITLGKIHISFSSLTLSEVKYTHKNGIIYLKDVEVLPSKSFIFGFDPNKLVRMVHIGTVNIIPNKELSFEESKQEDYSIYLNYIKKMRTLQIDKITYSNTIIVDKTIFEKIDEFLYFNTTAYYKNNQVNAKGTINLYKALKLNKVDADILVNSNKIGVKQFNELFDNPYFILTNGSIKFNEKIEIKNNNILLSGLSEIDNLKINLFNKPMNINKLKVKNTYANQKLNLDFINNIKVNNTPFNIRKISINADKNLKNIKHVIIQSKLLNYQGTFSNKFIEDTKQKEIKVKFNIVDLNYFNRLGVITIPEPYNQTIIKNGLFSVVFNKDNKNVWHTNYKVSGDASLKVDDVLLEANGVLEDNKLSLNSFKLNNKPEYGTFNYDLHNNNFYLDIKADVDKPIFAHIKKQYYVPFDIELLNDLNTVKLDLKLDHKDHSYTYSGLIDVLGNDLSFKYADSNYLLTQAKGTVAFSTHAVDSFNISANKIENEGNAVTSVSLNGSYKDNIISSHVETPNLSGKLIYDIGLDALKLDVNKAHFSLTDNSKNNIITSSNNEQNSSPIQLPQKVDLFISDLKIDEIDVGSINLKSTKKDNDQYRISTVLVNDSTELKVNSELDSIESTIKNEFKLEVDDLQKFNKRYHLEDTIKDGNLKASGTINTNFKDMTINSIIDKSEGKIELSSEDGEFTKMDSNGGFILNLLSFQTIPNLASLQLGNIFTNKFSYDTINGNLILNKGNLEIENLDIKSKISDASLNGYIDIKEQQLNLGLTVTPKLTNSVVFTAVTAASVFNPLFLLGGTILEKIIPLPEMVKYKYKINGTLEYPILSNEEKVKLEMPKNN
jgi:hypothetical protein